ncbi:MAG: metalloregulator ArsR/SmtB family transcription factor [Phycisphaeraceae bacterium]
MRDLLTISKALNDETRIRLLSALRDGELCVCQVVELLELAPSTVSRHLDLLHQARLVERRKDGRWHYYRLAAGRDVPAVVRQALRWVLSNVDEEKVIVTDAKRLCCIREKTPEELTSCYRTPAKN